MTNETQQARRAAFEALFPIPENVYWHEIQCSYAGKTGGAPWWLYQDRFEVYCAALDSIVIELPESYSQSKAESYPHCSRYNDCLGECRDAIHAAGVRTR